MVKQSALHPHNLSAKRIAQIEKWRLMGAQARRGKHVAQRETFQRKRAKRGRSVTAALAKTSAWGVQKMVIPVGLGGGVGAIAKNRLPGYNQVQIAKSSTRRATKGRHGGKLG
jgi:hypothetical protein